MKKGSVTITRESQKRMNQGFNHLQDTTDHINKVQTCTTRDAWEGQGHGLYYSRTYIKTSIPLLAKKRICTMSGNSKWGHTLAMLKKMLIDTKNGKY